MCHDSTKPRRYFVEWHNRSVEAEHFFPPKFSVKCVASSSSELVSIRCGSSVAKEQVLRMCPFTFEGMLHFVAKFQKEHPEIVTQCAFLCPQYQNTREKKSRTSRDVVFPGSSFA